MDIDFPFHIDERGRTGAAAYADHVRDMIEAVLFTAPGERVNRPSFGCGLLQLVFAPNSPELAATAQYVAQGALQQWLGEVIQVSSVAVDSEDSTLRVRVEYSLRRTQEKQSAEFERQV
jgi:phage baseplate assembly protein W